jgi:hypothetical protein
MSRWFPQGVPPAIRVYQISVSRHMLRAAMIRWIREFFSGPPGDQPVQGVTVIPVTV